MSNEEMFEIFHEHCRNGHLVITSYEDNKVDNYFYSCFLREKHEFSNRDKWKCCFEECPLLK